MTIEIKQLVVRAVVESRADERSVVPALPVPVPLASPPPDPALNRDALVAECARLVLRELRRGRER